MADWTIVNRVSRALENMLTESLLVVDPLNPPLAVLHNLKPPPSVQPPVLTLFLYEIVEDPTSRNRPPVSDFNPPTGSPSTPGYTIRKTPMALILRYLLTPWAERRDTEYLMIGRTMQVLYERQIHRGADLTPELDLEPLSVTLAPLSLEERTRVWWSIQESYRLSLNYEVRVIDLDISPGGGQAETAVQERQIGLRLPEEQR